MSKHLRIRVTCILFCTLVFFGLISSRLHADALTDQCKRAWNDFVRSVPHYIAKGKIRTDITFTGDTKNNSSSVTEFTLKYSAPNIRVDSIDTAESGQPRISAFAQNAKYGFQVIRNNNDWLIDETTLHPKKKRVTITDILHSSIQKMTIFPKLAVSRDYQYLDSFSQLNGNTIRLDKEFECFVVKQSYRCMEGTVTLNGGKYMLPLKQEFKVIRNQNTPCNYRLIFEYKDLGGIPVLIHWQETEELLDQNNKHISTLQKTLDQTVELIDSDNTDFTLTAFGLPEPTGIVWERPTPNYVWFLVAAGTATIITIALRFIVKHRRTTIATLK